jgi:hypothetical protein
MNWLRRQYNDIKGNFKWAVLGLLWVGITWAGPRLLHLIPNMPAWPVWVIGIIASATLFVWVASNRGGGGGDQKTAPAATNALIGPPANFDAALYFQKSYASPLQQGVENNARAAATHTQPHDREGFYVRLIAVGLIAYVYDIVWAYVFRSQILLLTELNRKMLPLAEVKPYYDRAASSDPSRFANYSFDQWMDFMKGNFLLIHHPSAMVEITERGRDFLKYLIHWGRSADDRLF